MLEPISIRRSIRKYKNQAVETEKINQLIESARLAPSGNNSQPAHYIIVNDEENRRKLAMASHKQEWMMTAPTFIICVADIRCRLKEEDLFIDENSSEHEVKQIIRDTAIATEHIVVEASNLGLGSCYVAWFTQEEIRPLLNLTSDKYVMCILTIGYPDENPNPRPRKAIEDIIHYEKW